MEIQTLESEVNVAPQGVGEHGLRRTIREMVEERDYATGLGASIEVRDEIVRQLCTNYLIAIRNAHSAKFQGKHFTPHDVEYATIMEHLRSKGLLRNTRGGYAYQTTEIADDLIFEDRVRRFH